MSENTGLNDALNAAIAEYCRTEDGGLNLDIAEITGSLGQVLAFYLALVPETASREGLKFIVDGFSAVLRDATKEAREHHRESGTLDLLGGARVQ